MKRPRESGFALLLVFLLAAGIAISLYLEMPRVAFESQRGREQMAIDRGLQYQRAIQLFYRKFRTYPQNLDDLETTRNIRFLRRRYLDPLTGKEWRLLHVGPGGVLTDSLITPAPNPAQDKNAGATASNASQQPGAPAIDPNTGQPVNPGLNMALRRPSDRTPGMGPEQPVDPNQPPQYPPQPGQPGYQYPPQPGQPGYQYPPQPGQPGDPNQPGQPGQPVDPSQPPNPPQPGQPGYPGQPVYPGQPGYPNQPPYPVQPGIPGIPGVPGQPIYPGQPAYPGQPTPYPGQPAYPGQPGYPGQPIPYPGQPVQPQYPGQPGIYPSYPQPGGYPGQPVVQPGISGQPFPNPAYPGAVPGGFNSPPGTPGVPGQASNQAVNMIQRLLTTPRQPPSGIGSGISGGPSGIAGVASNAEGEGIHVINEHKKYKEWEFVYDLKNDKSALGAVPAGAVPNLPGVQIPTPTPNPNQGPISPFVPPPSPAPVPGR